MVRDVAGFGWVWVGDERTGKVAGSRRFRSVSSGERGEVGRDDGGGGSKGGIVKRGNVEKERSGGDRWGDESGDCGQRVWCCAEGQRFGGDGKLVVFVVVFVVESSVHAHCVTRHCLEYSYNRPSAANDGIAKYEWILLNKTACVSTRYPPPIMRL